MSQARSLKDTCQPEFEEKLNRLKQLRDLRTGYQDKISTIKNNIKGLECKTEASGFGCAWGCDCMLAWHACLCSGSEDHAFIEFSSRQAELDARIVELEDKIRFGSIPLREEKMVVNDINKLRGQREKIKEFELHKASLVELEAENKKVKAVIEEMDGETVPSDDLQLTEDQNAWHTHMRTSVMC